MTTEYRGHTGRLPERPGTDSGYRPAVGSGDDRFARDLPALRAAVLTMPDSASRLLQKQLHRTGGPGQVDVMILLAEAFLRCRDAAAAWQAAEDAVHAADSLHPIDNCRRLCAYGVAADVTLYCGQSAVAVYNDYLHQLTANGDWARDALRTVYARAGLAVATCREVNRDHGLWLLNNLCGWSRETQGRHHALTATLVHGLTALYRGCSECGRRAQRRTATSDAALAPLPGGILQPDLGEPDRVYLASRVHDCPLGR